MPPFMLSFMPPRDRVGSHTVDVLRQFLQLQASLVRLAVWRLWATDELIEPDRKRLPCFYSAQYVGVLDVLVILINLGSI